MYMHECHSYTEVIKGRCLKDIRLEMIKQNEIKVLLMANVHGGKLHHPDTEAMKGKNLLCFLFMEILFTGA